MKTFTAKPENIEQKWYVIDASDKVLGRMSAKIAHMLQGKHKPIYTPHIDTGDFIIVTNAKRVKVTGNKERDKIYYRFTGYIGGMKETPLKEMREKHPERVIELAVRRMLPKGRLGRAMFKKLKVYAGSEHPHTAQKPEIMEI